MKSCRARFSRQYPSVYAEAKALEKHRKRPEYVLLTVRPNMTYPLIAEQSHGPKLEAWVGC